MSKTRIAVLFGGKSGEHEVSRVSATSVIKAIDKDKYDIITIGITKDGEWLLYEGPLEDIAPGAWEVKAKADLAKDPAHFQIALLGTGGKSLKDICDFVFPVLHGPNGEDGTVQGLLKLIGLPFAGSGVVGCSTTMDKIVAKEIFAAAGLKQAPYIALTADQIGPKLEARINKELRYPLFIKPANMGSSVGITRIESPDQLLPALEFAARYDFRIVAEQGIDARELETAVMGNEELLSSAVGEIIPDAVFYDYDAKYNNSESKTLVPADLTQKQADEIRESAKIAYKACDCCGFSRVDFLMDKSTGDIYINEINAIPGFTSISMFPMLFQAAGLSYTEIVEKIIQYGYERYNTENKR